VSSEGIDAALDARPTRRLPSLRDRWLFVGGGVLLVMLVLSFLAPSIAGHGPNTFVASPNLSPSGAHPFGTDSYGRDVFVRTFVAARIDFLIAAIAVGVSVAGGTFVGVLVGMARTGKLRWALGLATDAVLAFPAIVLVLSLVVAFGAERSILGLPAGVPALLVALFVVGWAVYARLAVAQTLSLRDRDFVRACTLMGYPRRRIVLRHVLPNVLPVALAYAVADAVVVITVTASLAFIGAGPQPPTAEWGEMIYESRSNIGTAWWGAVCPGVALVVSALALSTMAAALLTRVGGDRR
jgi:peptide/nickel transport system permease protein